jgi:hypothetical protein
MREFTAAQLKRMALEDGAELEIDGRRFNTERAEVMPEPPAPPEPAPLPQIPPQAPAPPPEVPDTLSRDEVQEMLRQQADDFRRQIDAVTRAFASALAAMPKPELGQPRQPWSFRVNYDRHGAIEDITATPIEG